MIINALALRLNGASTTNHPHTYLIAKKHASRTQFSIIKLSYSLFILISLKLIIVKNIYFCAPILN